jgi:hypothetical protein
MRNFYCARNSCIWIDDFLYPAPLTNSERTAIKEWTFFSGFQSLCIHEISPPDDTGLFVFRNCSLVVITCSTDMMVRAQLGGVYKASTLNWIPHTYLDGTSPFKYPGLWGVGTLHSTATLSIQRVTAACMGFGSCTVSIFSCPASATLAGRAPFFRLKSALTLTPKLEYEK